MGRQRVGLACDHKGCSFSLASPDEARKWDEHREETGHTRHRLTNLLSEKGKNEFNAPYSHPSQRF